MFCTFWLRNVLRTTTACNFSSLIWPAGSAPAALASLLFDPPEPQIIGKTQCFETFFFLLSSFFFLLPSSFFFLLSSFFFSSLLSSPLLFSSLLFSSLTLPISAFSSVHIVRSLTSKLPSASRHNWFRYVIVSAKGQIYRTVLYLEDFGGKRKANTIWCFNHHFEW